jgi:hypothetical protein
MIALIVLRDMPGLSLIEIIDFRALEHLSFVRLSLILSIITCNECRWQFDLLNKKTKAPD